MSGPARRPGRGGGRGEFEARLGEAIPGAGGARRLVTPEAA